MSHYKILHYNPEALSFTIDEGRIIAGNITNWHLDPTTGTYSNPESITGTIDTRSMGEFLKVWDYRPISHRKQNVYTKEEGGNWYFKSITSGKECGPYGTEEEAKKHERNINGK